MSPNGQPGQSGRQVAHVTGVGRHHGQVVLVDDLLHPLDAAEVAEHVADRDDVPIVDEGFGDRLGRLDRAGSDGLARVSALAPWHTPMVLTFSTKYAVLGKYLMRVSSRSVPLVVPPR